jgi:Putative phage tail protein
MKTKFSPKQITVTVVHCKNPVLRSEKSFKPHLTGRCTAYRFLEREGYLAQDAVVAINGVPQTNTALKSHRLANDDVIEVAVVAGDGISLIVWLAEVGFSGAAIDAILAIGYAVGSYVVNAVVAAGIQVLIGAISGNGGSRGDVTAGGAANGTSSRNGQDKGKEAYGLSGGGNSFRQNQGMPVLMGTHRIFPDFGSRWWLDYILDPNGDHFVLNSTPNLVQRNVPVFYTTSQSPVWTAVAPWSLVGGDPDQTVWEPLYYGDNATRTYVDKTGDILTCPYTFAIRVTRSYDTITELVTETYDFTTYEDLKYPTTEAGVNPYTGTMMYQPNWRSYPLPFQPPSSTTQNIDVIASYGYQTTENTQRLNAVFNYGFGDLTLSNHYIGTTPASDFYDVTLNPSQISYAGNALGGWTHADGATTVEFPSDVETESNSGGLTKKPGQEGVWVIRETKRLQADYLELDISGSLFYNGNDGMETRNVLITVEYAVSGSNAWVAAPISPINIVNGDTTAVRETRGWAVPAGHYSVRARIENDDSDDARLRQTLTVESFKAYNTVAQTYQAQNRLGVQIRASKQLNGALDRWSSLVSTKTWVYTAAAWDGSIPGASANWVWQTSLNPAWWFLNFALGSFINTGVPASHPLTNKGWMLGEALAGSANGQKLYGLGRRHNRIDYAKIIEWAQWCVANNLNFSAVVDRSANCFDILSDIARIGRAQLSQSAGKISVIYFTANDPAVQLFSMDNIVAGSFSISYISETPPDRVIVNYIDSTRDYQSAQVEAVVPGVAVPITEAQITLWGCINEAQAQREANLVAAEQFYHRRTISWETDIEGLLATRGDVVALGHDLTQWAQSARIVRFIVSGGAVTGLELNRELHDPSAPQPYYVCVRLPNGQLPVYQAQPPATPSFMLTLTTPMPLANAAGILDQQNTTNAASYWSNALPQDYLVMAGVQSVPGKKVRILNIAPTAEGKVRLTAVDHVPAYYASEYIPVAGTFSSEERLVAKVINAGIVKDAVAGVSRLKLVWQLESAQGAIISLSVNGGISSVIASGAGIAGTELVLPAYPSGTTLAFTLTPVPILTAVALISASVIYTV